MMKRIIMLLLFLAFVNVGLADTLNSDILIQTHVCDKGLCQNIHDRVIIK